MSGEARNEATDSRVHETRTRVLDAFGRLVLDRPYARIRVGDLIDEAGVGRSTFYEHYRNKDDVLRESMAPLLSRLASATDPQSDAAPLVGLMEHFRENRTVVLKLLEGESRDVVTAALADALAPLLATTSETGVGRLFAMSLAEAQFTLLRTWLREAQRSDAQSAATALRRLSVAVASTVSE